MAVAWTSITNAQVAAGAAVTTALMTALRDNPEGIAQRAAGAPKIFGVPYDYQEFTAGGTWTKPSNAETGDKVVVQVVGGGGAGQRTNPALGGGGGAGNFHRFEDIDDLGATETVTVGAGGAPSAANGADGGNSSFGTNDQTSTTPTPYLLALGGQGGGSGGRTPQGAVHTDSAATYGSFATADSHWDYGFSGGGGGNAGAEYTGGSSIFGGGGGGGNQAGTAYGMGGNSAYAGRGGIASPGSIVSVFNYQIDGEFPGGGGGAVNTQNTNDTVGGAGADGIVRVWCFREDA